MITKGNTLQDIQDVYGNMRIDDYHEASLLYPEHNADDLMLESVEASQDTFTFREHTGGKCLGIGGVYNHPDMVGYMVWFVGHRDVGSVRLKKLLWSDAKVYVKTLTAKYHRLWNFCANRPELVRMLTKLGFDVQLTDDPNVRYFQCVL